MYEICILLVYITSWLRVLRMASVHTRAPRVAPVLLQRWLAWKC
jgi:hypothetical protein